MGRHADEGMNLVFFCVYDRTHLDHLRGNKGVEFSFEMRGKIPIVHEVYGYEVLQAFFPNSLVGQFLLFGGECQSVDGASCCLHSLKTT